MKKINKIAIALTTIAMTIAMGAGCQQLEGILGEYLPELFPSSNSGSHFEEEPCEETCPRCGGCQDDAHDCETKCDCRQIDWTYKNVRLSVEGRDGLPTVVTNGTTLTLRVSTVNDEYPEVSVSVNGKEVQASNGRYKITVKEDCKVEVLGVHKSEVKGFELVDATVVLRNGKPCYLLKGEHVKYTQEELSNFYFDMQNYPDFNSEYDWHTTKVSYELVYTTTTFEMYVDLSSFPVDTCLIPHFNGTGGAGDIKVANSDGKSVTVDNIRYTIDFGATSYGVAAVVIMDQSGTQASIPSDTTAPVMNAISNYEYFKTTDIPRIDINTENGIALDDDSLIKGWKVPESVLEYDYTNADISVSNCEGYELTDVAAKVKIRGNYSSTYPKRPIRIKFDKKQKMCGLSDDNKFKNWVLLADYKDSSMLRNSVALYLGNSMLNADGLYCSDFRYVEVYLNGKYNGLYLLVEQQEVKDDKRISVSETPDPEDDPVAADTVKIGYSVEFDGYYYTEKDLEKFTVNYDRLRLESGSYVNVHQNGFSIKSDVYYTKQRDFIKKCIQNIWDIVYDATYKSHYDLTKQPFYTLDENGNKVKDYTIKTPREAVEKVIDVRSLVDTYILNEICQDMDLGWSSFYMSLDMSEGGDRLLKFEAPWDFDSTLGSAAADNTKLFALNRMSHNGGTVSPNPWLMVCAREGWFWTHVQAKWKALEEAGTFTGVIEMIDYFSNNYVDIYQKNFKKWPECIGRKIEYQQIDLIATFKTEKQAATYLKTWLTERIENLGKLIDGKVKAYIGTSK